jgi:hypothetical protein
MPMKFESHKYYQETNYATCTARSQVSRFLQIFGDFAIFFFTSSRVDVLSSFVLGSCVEHIQQDCTGYSTPAICGLPVFCALQRCPFVPEYMCAADIIGKTTQSAYQIFLVIFQLISHNT